MGGKRRNMNRKMGLEMPFLVISIGGAFGQFSFRSPPRHLILGLLYRNPSSRFTLIYGGAPYLLIDTIVQPIHLSHVQSHDKVPTKYSSQLHIR